ncbi:MAG: magnesium transporter [archaeon GB-1845-036]|nr:magnesium transporter [Candidatus Culexmicrobium thermophilum]
MHFGAIVRLFSLKSFLNVFLQSMLALAFSSFGIFSGRIISNFNNLFVKFSWVLALYPALMTLRGDIGGVFSGRLSTMLNTGRIYPKFRGNLCDFYSLIRGIFFTVYIDASSMGLITFILNFLAGNANIVELPLYVTASISTCVLATLIILPFSLLIAFTGFKRGLDPDIVVYPMKAILSDVMVAFSYAFIIYMLGNLSSISILLLIIIIFIPLTYLFYHFSEDLENMVFKSIIRESSPLVVITSFGGVVNGVFLSTFSNELAREPAILIIYPVILNSLGGVGSIFGSLTTTKLALGFIRSRLLSISKMFSEFLGLISSSMLMSIFFSVLGYLFALSTGIKIPFLRLLTISFFVGFFGAILISILSFMVGIVSFNWGLDPDNIVIPVESSMADIIGTIIILILNFLILG